MAEVGFRRKGEADAVARIVADAVAAAETERHPDGTCDYEVGMVDGLRAAADAAESSDITGLATTTPQSVAKWLRRRATSEGGRS